MPMFDLKAFAAQYTAITRSLQKIANGAMESGYDDPEEVSNAPVVDLYNAAVLSSAVIDADGDPTGRHKILVDLDVPAMLIPSSQEGHSHLIIDKKVTWEQYRHILFALRDAGLVEEGYVGASARREAGHLRTPWTLKEKATITDERRKLARDWKDEITPEQEPPF